MSEDWPTKYHNTPYTVMEKALVVHHLMKWKDRAEKAEARVKELEARCKYLEAQADCFVPADQYFEERRKGMWK